MLTSVLPPFVESRPRLRAVLEWASDQHASQLRAVDRAPFILHPLEVAALLHGRGFDDEVVAAGLLHDVVEKTDADFAEVRRRFGERVADLVAAVTEDPAIADYEQRKAALRDQVAAVTEDPAIADYEQRKAALRDQVAAAGPDALAVYAADKVAKARELRAQAARAESSLDDPALRRRLDHYEASLRLLRPLAGDLPIVDQLAFELWALRALPPASDG